MVRFLAMCLCGLSLGCGSEDPLPERAPRGRAYSPAVFGVSGEEEDAGALDAELPAAVDSSPVRSDECYDSEAGGSVPFVSLPSDFTPTRAYAGWGPGCQTLRVGLSDGMCPDGEGHELSFEFNRRVLQDGGIFVGLNVVEPEPNLNGVRVRYRRLSDPVGLWGNCPGSSGTLDVTSLETFVSTLSFAFSLDLSPCGDTMDRSRQSVVGSVSVPLRRSAQEACP